MSPENAAIYKAQTGVALEAPGAPGDPMIETRRSTLDAMLDAARKQGATRSLVGCAVMCHGDIVGSIWSGEGILREGRPMFALSGQMMGDGKPIVFELVPIPAVPAPTPIEERVARLEAQAHPPVAIEPIVEELLDRKLGSLGDRVAVLEEWGVGDRLAAGKMSLNDARRFLGLAVPGKADPATSEDEFSIPAPRAGSASPHSTRVDSPTGRRRSSRPH